jgi:hypothetical protein
MDLAQLTKLKAKLLTSSEFSSVLTYFMDHFGEKPEFIALGARTRHALVEAVIVQVAKEIFGKDVSPKNLILTRLADEQFIHGGFLLDGCLANVIYFDDVHVGLISVCMGYPSKETKFARFTGMPLSRRPEPSMN